MSGLRKRTRSMRRRLMGDVIWIVTRIINGLSDSVTRRLASFLGQSMYIFSVTDRKRILDNLERIFGTTQPEQSRKKLARSVCIHLAQAAIEAIRLQSKEPNEIRSTADDAGFETAAKESFQRGRSIMIITAHYGNWELFAARVALIGPLTVLARKNPNPKIERLIQDIRDRNRVRVIDRSDPAAPREMIRMGHEGGHILGILMDQDTTRIQGIFSPFMGIPALTPSGPASIAIRGLYDVYVGMLRPLPDGHHVFDLDGPLPIPNIADRSEGIQRLTDLFNAALSEKILRAPEYWVWNHRRWRRRPPTESMEGI
ncbi:hypothetical protein JXA80_10365 [bacterium]|nr:hypothetical protein [candidate division CSSED10-310 bacterium]